MTTSGAATRAAALDPAARAVRHGTARALGAALTRRSQYLHTLGHIIGNGRIDGSSPQGNGDDRPVGIGYLCGIAGALLTDIEALIETERHYSAAALGRQLVEAEYLLWAFETDHQDAANWLNSTDAERRQLWQPRHLRQRSAGRFPNKEYSIHCELGGHPTPDGFQALLNANDGAIGEVTLADSMGHAARC